MQRSSKLSKQTRLETGFHGQVAIKCNTKVLDRARQWNDVLPTVIESGKERERDLDFLPEDTICFSFVAIYFKIVQCHPGFNVIHTFLGADIWS